MSTNTVVLQIFPLRNERNIPIKELINSENDILISEKII